MTVLRSGVVSKLLDAMKNGDEERDQDDNRNPVLLQIRGIIPVLEEGDLWPNRGFYMRVSDSSQAIYVSLPQEQNEMILSNKLKLGQHVYVEKLEKSDPVPLLIGLTMVPGRRVCEGSPEDVNSPTTLSRFLQSTNAGVTDMFVEEKGVISEEKVSRNLNSYQSDGLVRPKGRRSRSVSALRTRSRMSLMRSKVNNDDDSDTDSTLSSVSSSSKRKSWTQSEILGVKEIFDSSVSKNDVKQFPRSRSANVSPVRRSLRHDISDEYSTLIGCRRDVKSTRKSTKGAEFVKNSAPKAIPEQTSHPFSSLLHDAKGAETAIAWKNLPAALVKLGKEVAQQRDLAVIAAADALQEACAAERLLKSLSTYSELNASEGVDLQTHIDKFSDLQEFLSHNNLIIQSLTKITPSFKTSSETDATSSSRPHSVKETLDTALVRKKNATKWIKSAVSLDLSPNQTSSVMIKKPNRGEKPKGPSIMIKKQRSIDDIPHMLITDRDCNHSEWTKGGSLCAATELANAIQDECRKLFLDYLDKYLDEFESKMKCEVKSDSQIAEMMCKVKRVNDLLVLVAGKEPNCSLDDAERVTCGRAREKIYGILLSNIERTSWLCKNSNSVDISNI